MAAKPRPRHPWRGNRKKRAKPISPERPCEFIMRRLRVEYGLEFVFADLSGKARGKVLQYAKLWHDLEELRRKRIKKRQRAARKLLASIPSKGDIKDDDEVDEVADVVSLMGGRAYPEK